MGPDHEAMNTDHPTPFDHAAFLSECARVHEAATQQPWQAARMVHAERGDALSPDELGEYVANSVRKSATESSSQEFYFVPVQKDDGPADVCLTGNGPTSGANARAIAHYHNTYAALLDVARNVEDELRVARILSTDVTLTPKDRVLFAHKVPVFERLLAPLSRLAAAGGGR